MATLGLFFFTFANFTGPYMEIDSLLVKRLAFRETKFNSWTISFCFLYLKGDKTYESETQPKNCEGDGKEWT